MPSFKFFLGAVSEIQKSKFFPFFQRGCTHHMTYHVIIIIKTFDMSSHSNGENFVSIRQAVGEKNTKVLCRQKNRQTNKEEKDVVQSTVLAKSTPLLQRLPWIHQTVHLIKIKIDNLNQSSGQSDENILFQIAIADFRSLTLH